MIDNYAKAMALIENIKSHLPITAYPAQNLLRLIQQKKINLSFDQDVLIEDVMYMGDEGGICCNIRMPEGKKEVLIASLTHLRIPNKHPLSKEINDYQKKRIKNLSNQ